MRIGYTDGLYSGTATVSSNTQANPVFCDYASEAVVFLDITAISGTLDIEIQTHNTLTDKWHKLAEFTQKSGTGKDEGFIQYGLGERLAVKYIVSNTATFTVDVHLKE